MEVMPTFSLNKEFTVLFNIFKRTPKPGERYLSDNPYNEVPVTVISTQGGYIEFQEPWKAGRTVMSLTSFRICFPKLKKD
jgi:hypothetical protein